MNRSRKYDGLRTALAGTFGDEAVMRFGEIEALLGFPLPRSARTYREWWANTGGTHVQATAWLQAGWRATQVDLDQERVVFVRGDSAASRAAPVRPSGVEDADPAVVVIRREALTPAAIRLIEDCAEELGAGWNEAAAFALNAAAVDRRRKLIEEFAALAPAQVSDSVDLIREDRDAR
jgi:hypothetical protein